MARASAVALALALLLAPARAALADPDDRGTAAALFDDARKLAKDGKYADACPKFEAALRIKPGIGIEYNLGDCYEHVGKTASAWLAFRDVAAQAVAQSRTEQEKDARARIAALEPKLVRLQIVVKDRPSGLVVKRDGEAIAEAVWGTAVPVDPGEHAIEASAPGKIAFTTRAQAKDAGTTATIEIPALADAPKGAVVTPPPDTTPIPKPGPTTPVPDATPKRAWQKPVGIVAAIAGAIGVGVGVGVGFSAKSSLDASNADGHCVKNACDAVGAPLRNDAVSKGNIATIAFVAGAVVAAGGVVLVLTAPSAPKTNARELRLRVGGTSLTAEGTF